MEKNTKKFKREIKNIYNNIIKNDKKTYIINLYLKEQNLSYNIDQLIILPDGKLYIFLPLDPLETDKNRYNKLIEYLSFEKSKYEYKIQDNNFKTIFIKFDTNHMNCENELETGLKLQLILLEYGNYNFEKIHFDYFPIENYEIFL